MSARQFAYHAFDASGQAHKGQIAADSEREAIRLLQGRHLTPVKLVPAEQSGGSVSRGSRKIRPADLLAFTNGLKTLVEARVPLDKSLRLLEGITESAAMRELVAELRNAVKEGKSLADAMESHPQVFSRMYINIVRAGEEGGILHQLLPGLADFLETSARNRAAVVAAMVYPIVL